MWKLTPLVKSTTLLCEPDDVPGRVVDALMTACCSRELELPVTLEGRYAGRSSDAKSLLLFGCSSVSWKPAKS